MIACIDIVSLPLQLVLAERKQWRTHPVAIVAEDKAQALLIYANEAARKQGILPGMRYSQALSLYGQLRATAVSDEIIARWQTRIVKTLRRYSPRIDPAANGLFFVDASGLSRLYPSLEFWGRAILAELKGMGLIGTIVIGHERMTTHAIAAESRGLRFFDDRELERRAAYAVRLDRLELKAKTRDRLAKLGVHTIADLAALPENGLAERFGAPLATLVATWKGHRPAVLVNQAEELPLHAIEDLDEACADSERLLFLTKRLLHPLLDSLQKRGEALKELHISLAFEGAARAKESMIVREMIAPAEPTLDEALLLDLVRLRLNALLIGNNDETKKGVKRLGLGISPVRATQAQLSLFAAAPKRDLRAAERAFSRLRAEFGNDSVVVAKAREGHLPEARFQLTPLLRVTTPAPRLGTDPPAFIRRFHRHAQPLPKRSRTDPEAWLIGGLEHGAVTQVHGPHIISGGWWRGEIQRDFYFISVKRGDLLWVYFDHSERQWRLQGRLE